MNTTTEKLLTIAIPAYNASWFLPKCLQSLVDSKQMESMEVLVVDDGSQNDPTAVVEPFIDQFPRSIRLIHKAGGRAVWAHPLFVYRNFEKRKLEKEEIQVILQYLKTCGLDGIEANYSAFDSSEKEWIYRVAQDAKLFCTSGSDFHGSKGRDFMGMKVLHEDWIG